MAMFTSPSTTAVLLQPHQKSSYPYTSPSTVAHSFNKQETPVIHAVMASAATPVNLHVDQDFWNSRHDENGSNNNNNDKSFINVDMSGKSDYKKAMTVLEAYNVHGTTPKRGKGAGESYCKSSGGSTEEKKQEQWGIDSHIVSAGDKEDDNGAAKDVTDESKYKVTPERPKQDDSPQNSHAPQQLGIQRDESDECQPYQWQQQGHQDLQERQGQQELGIQRGIEHLSQAPLRPPSTDLSFQEVDLKEQGSIPLSTQLPEQESMETTHQEQNTNTPTGSVNVLSSQEVSSKPRSENGTTTTKSSLMNDIRSKTQNVLRKAGFSIAPEAGLYNSTRYGNGAHGKDHMDPNNLIVSNLSHNSSKNNMTPTTTMAANNISNSGNSNSNGVVGRPRSRSIRERWLGVTCRGGNNGSAHQAAASSVSAAHMIQVPPMPPSLGLTTSITSQQSPTGSVSSSAGRSFVSVAASVSSSAGSIHSKGDRLRPWTVFSTARGSQRQRCNSGPARHSDPSLTQRMAHTLGKSSLDISHSVSRNSISSIMESSNPPSSSDSFYATSGGSTSADRHDTKDSSSMFRSFFSPSRISDEVKKRRHIRQVSDTTHLFSGVDRLNNMVGKQSFLSGMVAAAVTATATAAALVESRSGLGPGSGSGSAAVSGLGSESGTLVSRGKQNAIKDPKNRLSMMATIVQCLPPPPSMHLSLSPSSPSRTSFPSSSFGKINSISGATKNDINETGSICNSVASTSKPRSKNYWFGKNNKRELNHYTFTSGGDTNKAAMIAPDMVLHPLEKGQSDEKFAATTGGTEFTKQDENESLKADIGTTATPNTTTETNTTTFAQAGNSGTESRPQVDLSNQRYATAAATLLSQHQYINDYGFIYDLEDEDSQEYMGTGSMVGEMSSAASSVHFDGMSSSSSSHSHLWGSEFWAEHERRSAIRKQEALRHSELKWTQAIAQIPVDQVKKSSKFKKLVRKGIPGTVRGRVWQYLAKADSFRQPGLFAQLLTRPPIEPIYDVIGRDIHRCYPDHIHFRDGMGGTGQQDLHAILRAYAQYNPRVGYCQGMGRLVGMMLMQMPVEDAFWLLVATLDGYMQDYYTPTLRQLRIDALVFEQILKAHDPKLSDHLTQNDVMPLMYMTQWFLTLFTMSLPWASVLQVWDIFYFDGVKSLFRVGLAILQLCRDHLLHQCPSSSELMDFLLHVPLDLLAPKPLFEAAFRIKLSKDAVQRMIMLTAGGIEADEPDKTKEKDVVENDEARKDKNSEKKDGLQTSGEEEGNPCSALSSKTLALECESENKTDDNATMPNELTASLSDHPETDNDLIHPKAEAGNPGGSGKSGHGVVLDQPRPQIAIPSLLNSSELDDPQLPSPLPIPPVMIVTTDAVASENEKWPAPFSHAATMPPSLPSSTTAKTASIALAPQPPHPPPRPSSAAGSTPFSGLGGVFRTRKRAGTMHK
ncbi:hypothetical protein BGZ94_006643 [Podila epigama]|nr:hypothetical protein BGZ94_006643 [Podila epigama]